jgi:hypothetical protein
MNEEEIPKRRAEDRIPILATPTPGQPEVSQTAIRVGDDIRKWLRILIGTTVLLYVFLSLGIAYTWYSTTRTQDALCALKQDAQDQADAGAQFLIDHPDGFAGITAAELKRSIDRSKKTVDALDTVNC